MQSKDLPTELVIEEEQEVKKVYKFMLRRKSRILPKQLVVETEQLTDTQLQTHKLSKVFYEEINPLNAELNPIRHLLTLVAARHIVHVSRVRVNLIPLNVCNC